MKNELSRRSFLKGMAAVGALAATSAALSACGGSSAPAASSGAASSGAASSGAASSGAAAPAGDGVTIRLVNGKIEVDAQLKTLAEAYKAETGVTVEIESMGGGIDIQSTVKGYYQAGNMPEIFVNGGSADFGNWEGLLVDMKDCKWVADTDLAYVSETDGTIGFPYTIEAIGMAYNATILEAAGVDPTKLVNFAAYEEALKAIDAKKDELGLTAVVDICAEAASLYWSTGNHLFGQYLSAGVARGDTTYIDMLNDGGKLDEARFTEWAEFFKLLCDYGDPAMTVSGTYDQQILDFCSGKYAFVTQGSWIGATMIGDDADAYEAAGSFPCGMAPFAFSKTSDIDTILTASPSWWAVYKDSANADAAVAFLEWCATDPAQQILVEQAGFISPYNSCTYVASDPFAQVIADYTAAGKTSAWDWLDQIIGLAQNCTGSIIQSYAKGDMDTATFVSTMSSSIAAFYASNG